MKDKTSEFLLKMISQMGSRLKQVALVNCDDFLQVVNVPLVLFNTWLFWWALLYDFSWYWFLIFPLFFGTLMIWLIRGVKLLWRGEKMRGAVLFVPCCFAFCAFLYFTNTPKWVHFWATKPTLQEIRSNTLPFLKTDDSWRKQWPKIKEVELSNSQKALRVILWEVHDLGDTRYKVGYMHCPQDCATETWKEEASDFSSSSRYKILFSFFGDWHMISRRKSHGE